MEASPQLIQIILCKFLVNLPREELEDSYRLSHQAEKAYYYYMDHVLQRQEQTDWRKQRKDFFTALKEQAPSFLKINPGLLSDRLLESKPVCGAIILNREGNKILVVRVNEKYGFPKGKQNQGETLEDCAIRQVEEETGLLIAGKIDSRFRVQFVNHEAKIFFFIARGVSEDQRIKIDRHEIDDAFWMNIEQLRRQMATKFAERSKIAWALYEKDFANRQGSQQFIPKYHKKDSEAVDFGADPLRCFKLDQVKLQKIIWDSPQK